MAELFVHALKSVPEAKITAVFARMPDRTMNFAAQFGIPLAVTEYDRFLQEGEMDVVYISTPNEYHSDHCLGALRAGKAVLCEKPFALTAKEAGEIIKLARSRGIFCMEAMWMRFSPAVRDTLRLAREGKMGDLQFFSGALGFPYLADPANRLFRQPGGGALLDLGVYPLSLAQALLGSPEQVLSAAEFNRAGVDEQFAAILAYKGGAQATIVASLRAKLTNAASIHGSAGVLSLADPLYFPEQYRLTRTPPHSTGHKSSGRLASLRRYPLLRELADLRSKRNVRTVNKRNLQSGYAFEAAEVQRCLHAGLLESPEMSLGDTLSTLESMDRVRSAWTAKMLN